MNLAEQRAKLAADLLGTLVDAGLTRPEMVQMLKFSADVMEKLAAEGKSLDDLDKQASAGNLFAALSSMVPMDAIGSIASKGLDKVLGAGEKIVGSGIDTGMKYAPLIAGASLAVPALGGYALGHGMGTATDHGDEMVRSIHQREIVSLLRENARLAEQTRLVEEQRQKQLSSGRRARRFAG